MRNSKILSVLVFLIGIGFWIFSSFESSNVPIFSISAETLHLSVGLNKTCIFSIDISKGNCVVQYIPLSLYNWEMFKTSFNNVLYGTSLDDIIMWLIEQSFVSHVLTEVLFRHLFWLAIVYVFVLLFLSTLLNNRISTPVNNSNDLKNISTIEKNFVKLLMSKFLIEKFFVLAYVVVSKTPVNDMDNIYDFEKFVIRSLTSLTGVSVFAIWFIIVGAVQIIAQNIMIRIAETSKYMLTSKLGNPNRRRRCLDLIVAILSVSIYASSMTMTSLLTLRYLPTAYSCMLIFDSLRVLLNVVYVTFRASSLLLAIYYSPDSGKYETVDVDEDTVDVNKKPEDHPLAYVGVYKDYLIRVHSFLSTIYHIVTLSQYSFYMIFGIFVNRKIISILLSRMISDRIRIIFKTSEYTNYELLFH